MSMATMPCAIPLVKIAKAGLSESQLESIAVLNMAGVGTRYPDMSSDAIKRFPKEVAWDYIARSKEVIQWPVRKITSTR